MTERDSLSLSDIDYMHEPIDADRINGFIYIITNFPMQTAEQSDTPSLHAVLPSASKKNSAI